MINLSAASGRLVSVVFTTNNGTATAGSDYVADSRTVTFEPGATTQTVSVAVIGDLIDEPNENFTATLSTPVNATLGRKTGTATIFDDDGATVSISDATLQEPTAGNSATATFTVTVSGATSFPVTVMYSTVDGTATAGSDYVARTNQSLVFTSNASQTVSITVNDDSLIEGNEDFFVNLNSVSGGGVAIGDNQGRGLISEISPLLSLSLSCPITVNEGNSGNISLNCQVTLSAQSAITVTVDYSTSNGTATAPSDYISAVGKLTFAPGSTSKNVLLAVKGDVQTESDEAFTIRLSNVQVQQMIILTVVGDKLQEGNESFSLKLLNPIGASLSGSSQSTITIIDDDSVPPRYLYLPLVRKSANSAGTLPPFDAR